MMWNNFIGFLDLPCGLGVAAGIRGIDGDAREIHTAEDGDVGYHVGVVGARGGKGEGREGGRKKEREKKLV